MNTVKQNTDLILTSLAALATAEAIAALSNNVQTLSNKIDAITTQMGKIGQPIEVDVIELMPNPANGMDDFVKRFKGIKVGEVPAEIIG